MRPDLNWPDQDTQGEVDITNPKSESRQLKDDFLTIVKHNDVAMTVSLLNKHSQLIGAKDENGQTALHHSCHLGLSNMTQILMDFGGNIFSYDQNHQTPSDLAFKFKNKNHGLETRIIEVLDSAQDTEKGDTMSKSRDFYKSPLIRQFLLPMTQFSDLN